MFTACILMAGSGKRLNLDYNKALHKINNTPLFMYSVNTFLSCPNLGEIVLVCSEDGFDNYDWSILEGISVPIQIVVGGATRSMSSYIGVDNASYDIVLVHDAARPLISVSDITEIYNKAKDYSIVVSGAKVYDSIKRLDKNGRFKENINRESLFAASTPQAVHKEEYLDLFDEHFDKEFTDEASLYESVNCESIYYYYLKEDNRKLTDLNDLVYIENILSNKKLFEFNSSSNYRVGHSKDTHRLIEGRKFILGGIEIPHSKGFLAHSDGDVLLHAITEAIIGSIAQGDIGTHFSDKDPKYKNMDSKYFLLEAKRMLEENGYEIVNIDSIVYLEKPNLSMYKALIKENIANVLNISLDKVNIKATTKESLGLIGNQKACEAESVVLVKKIK